MSALCFEYRIDVAVMLLTASCLTLRLYPSSYPSSTIGGWLARGGAGFGSYESGWFRDNFILSLTIMKIAENDGGRPYATGLSFAGKAGRILGTERLERLKAFKSRLDPCNILNPGKVMQGGLMASALSFGTGIEPFIRRLGNHVSSKSR
jgi:FAD/FMN-containing dehydrogenase